MYLVMVTNLKLQGLILLSASHKQFCMEALLLIVLTTLEIRQMIQQSNSDGGFEYLQILSLCKSQSTNRYQSEASSEF